MKLTGLGHADCLSWNGRGQTMDFWVGCKFARRHDAQVDFFDWIYVCLYLFGSVLFVAFRYVALSENN